MTDGPERPTDRETAASDTAADPGTGTGTGTAPPPTRAPRRPAPWCR